MVIARIICGPNDLEVEEAMRVVADYATAERVAAWGLDAAGLTSVCVCADAADYRRRIGGR